MREQTDNPFLSIAVSEDVVFKPHKDPNDGNIPNTLLGISSYTGGELWLEDDDNAPANDQKRYWRVVKPGEKPRPGTPHATAGGRKVEFLGTRYHGTEAYKGSRKVLISYTPRDWWTLGRKNLDTLEALEFRVPGRYLDTHLSSTARQIADHQQQQNTAAHQQQQDKAASHHHTPEHQTPLVQGLQGSLGDGQGEYARSEFREEISDSESFSHGASLACAFHLKYKNTCVHCQASRGHRRAHYKIPRDQISTGVISFDLSGPHDKARDGARYFLVGVLVNKEATSVPYVRVQKSKKAVETLAGIKSILAQIRAEADNPEVVIRVHSDGGGEFTAANVVDEVAREGLWKTLSAAYEPEANGKAERQVQAVKEAATSLLLHADMPKSFWSYAVKQAAYELRLQALNIDRPVGTPTFGDPVGHTHTQQQKHRQTYQAKPQTKQAQLEMAQRSKYHFHSTCPVHPTQHKTARNHTTLVAANPFYGDYPCTISRQM